VGVDREDDLATYVERLCREPLLRRRMAIAARHSVEGRSWASVNAALVGHYRDVVDPSVGRRGIA